MAEVAFHFEYQPSNPLGPVVCLIREDLVRKRIHAAASFAGPNSTENGNARIEPSRESQAIWDSKASVARIVNLSNNNEKLESRLRGSG